ncbi:MAG TPA: mandelate racemase/muconate lactonizing enzyme family protein [Stellaceae bacterium]|nr:mandelate racemase/muconate lactonizing enzyme family protein [Stellaceae bacterium]
MPQASNRDDRIASVEVTLISIPLPRDFRGSVYHVTAKNCLITRVRTAGGAIGEAVNGEGDIAIHRLTAKLLRDEMASVLLGLDATRIEYCWERMWQVTHRMGLDRRAAVRAVACVDSALWDMLGKSTGESLHRLWGGYRDALPIIAIGGQYVDGFAPEDYGHEIEELRALGIGGCKFKVGGLSPAEDAARIRAARRAAGDDFILCADANRGWRRQDAIDFARRVSDLGLRWFEEPCHWSNDRRDMAAVRAATGLPIAAGQSEITAEACRDLLMDGAIDICNIDASWGGGPTAWLRIAHTASCFGAEMAHHGEPVVGAQLLAAVANGTYVETHHPDRDPIFHKMIRGRGTIANGVYTLGSGPGWGVDFDPDFVRHHAVEL